MNSIYYTLFIGIIIVIFYVVFYLTTRKKLTKKKRWMIECIFAGVFGVVIIGSTIFMNPPVHAKIEEDEIVFKSNEKIQISNIKNIEYFEDTEIELVANGFRWGNKDYYSGDANIRFLNTDETEKEYVYKCKAYLNGNSNDYILIQLKNSGKSYVFNFDETNKTSTFYDEIIKLYRKQENG